MPNKIKPSKIIEQFISYLENSQKLYEEAGTFVNSEDRKVQDFLHEIEFCNNCNERSRISKRLHSSRAKRREAKDKHLELEKVAKFYADQTNRPFIKSLKRLAQEQKFTEEYLEGERHYKKRGDDFV